ncbi:cyclophilin type peptidyl-prolyl cis-trans isomerase [Candidatus Magnetobacterium bavaricum]|uniref:Peptidyl-prolyl cis-trans isomerase n=1 Tax=Candidatus Magnetobacterium bavaricum TaxID=29290 RepID=A0A0F3GRU2_9BACT|nr:cyclophilin type peptidyl-prolyl cis-trans isomerase [Candidatus Magnetobacterium bavaricum]
MEDCNTMISLTGKDAILRHDRVRGSRYKGHYGRLWVCLFIIACFLSLGTMKAFSQEVKSKKFTQEEIKKMSEQKVVIKTKFGDIKLKFFPDVAPNHVNNFIELTGKGFYNGTTFHRVIPGFMIQGGDPNSKDKDKSKHGTGGPGYNVKAEFNEKPHKKGTLSMARAQDPDSAGSQFFICAADAPFLDRQYTVFGEVTEGLDVVDKIVSQPKDSRDNPNERIDMTVEIVKEPAKAAVK